VFRSLLLIRIGNYYNLSDILYLYENLKVPALKRDLRDLKEVPIKLMNDLILMALIAWKSECVLKAFQIHGKLDDVSDQFDQAS
jgi:hypothetical protein